MPSGTLGCTTRAEQELLHGEGCCKSASGCQASSTSHHNQNSNLGKQNYRKSKLIFLIWTVGFDQGSTKLLLESISPPNTGHRGTAPLYGEKPPDRLKDSFLRKRGD